MAIVTLAGASIYLIPCTFADPRYYWWMTLPASGYRKKFKMYRNAWREWRAQAAESVSWNNTGALEFLYLLVFIPKFYRKYFNKSILRQKQRRYRVAIFMNTMTGNARTVFLNNCPFRVSFEWKAAVFRTFSCSRVWFVSVVLLRNQTKIVRSKLCVGLLKYLPQYFRNHRTEWIFNHPVSNMLHIPVNQMPIARKTCL